MRYIESLVYQVKATDPAPLILPALMLFAAAVLASVPAAVGATRIDPVEMLRAELGAQGRYNKGSAGLHRPQARTAEVAARARARRRELSAS